MMVFPELLSDIDAGLAGLTDLPGLDRLMTMAEEVLVTWLVARGEPVEGYAVEGHWLLGLQQQVARANPGMATCREICRDIVYRRTVAQLYPEESGQAHILMAEAVRHLAIFTGGKLEQAGLGAFCRAAPALERALEKALERAGAA